MKAGLLFSLLLFIVSFGNAQTNVLAEQPHEEYENVHLHKLDSDTNKTSFIIWVKQSVKAHKHEHHTETLYVLEGAGDMKVGDKTMKIKAGDYLNVPENTVHSVIVTSEMPLKVISVQAPEFLGKDRVWVEE